MIVEELIARLGFKMDGEGNLVRFQSGLVAARMAAVGAVAAIAAGGVMLANSVIGVGETFENLTMRLTALEGSSEGAEKAMAWIKDFATKTPLQLEEVTQAYAQLKTFGLDPTNGSLQALTDTMAMNGGGADYLSGVTLALGQAWTKQKLQGEEALQLIERGVPVWEILATKMGLSVAEVQKLSEKGKLGRREIQYLIDEMGRRAAGASERFAGSLTGIKSNLEDLKTAFFGKIADAGFFDAFKGRLQALLDTLNRLNADGTLDRWAKRLSTALTSALGFIDATINVVVRLIDWWRRFNEAMGGVPNAVMLGAIAFLLLSSPIALVVGAIVALVAILDDLIAWFDGRPSIIGDFFNWLGEQWTAFTEWVSGIVSEITGVFSGIDWGSLGSTAVGAILSGLQTAWQQVTTWFGTIATGIVDTIASIDWNAVGATIVDGILAGLQAAWGNLTAWLQAQLAELSGMFTSWLPDFGGGVPALAGAGVGGGSWTDSLGGLFGGVDNAAATIASGGPSSVGPSVVQNTDNSTATVNAPINITMNGSQATPQAVAGAVGGAVRSAGTRAVSVSANEGGGGGF